MCADKKATAAYFDNLAEHWDQTHLPPEGTLLQLLDLADIRPGLRVLDVACGTGVLFPYMLRRGVESVTGVDISAGMLSQAERKFSGPQVHLIRADILACHFDRPFDRCILLDVLSHFPEPGPLLRRLAGYTAPGGRLTIAQLRCPDAPEPIPLSNFGTGVLAEMLSPWFVTDVQVNDPHQFFVSAIRTDAPAPTVPSSDKK